MSSASAVRSSAWEGLHGLEMPLTRLSCADLKILLWHGYLLGGTGSNVYTRALAREWSLAGHDVTVVCQERHPERYDLGGACVVVPDLPGNLLPVFVLDRYEGLEARLLVDSSAGGGAAHGRRVESVAPGVDVDEFRPVPREEALPSLIDEARRDPGDGDERHPDAGNAERFAEFFARREPTVVYFGKLIENKGVHILLEALPGLDARAVVVGFGDYREQLEALAPPGTLFTGALEHRHLRHLLPLCDVAAVPSIFPEAFGMVAAEAAAAGVLPVVSGHSGLAEVAAGIGEEMGPEESALLTFPVGDAAALNERLAAILAFPAEHRRALGLAARQAVAQHWSWSGVAARLLAEEGRCRDA